MIKLIKPLFTVLMLGAVVFISSCDKDDEPKPKTKTELISAHVWKMTRLKLGTLEGDPETCLADDSYEYKIDFEYRFSEGATKCDPDFPTTITGTWEFKSNETILAVSQTESGVTITLNYTILELTEDKLRLKFDFASEVEATYEPK